MPPLNTGERRELTTEKATAGLVEWIKTSLANYETPRLSDIAEKGAELGLGKTQSKAIAKEHFPSYLTTGRPQFELPRRHYRSYVLSFFYTVACDIAFFGRRSVLQSELGITKTEQAGCLVMHVLGTHYAIAEPLGPKGKSAAGLKKALGTCFERYKKQYDRYPRVILMDDEKAMSSIIVQAFLREHDTKLYRYKYSRNKSLLAEQLIRNIRQSLSMLRKAALKNGTAQRPWYHYLPGIIKHYNGRPIRLSGVTMPMTPNDVTPENFHELQDYINEKFPTYSLMSFSIDTKQLPYKYPVGTRVYLKKRAIKQAGIGDKWSEAPLDTTHVWVIKKHAAHVTKQQTIILGAYLESEDGSVQTYQEEDALVPVGASE